MQSIEQVYKRLQKSKSKKRELSRILKDELASDNRYNELQEKLKTLREEKKSIENEIKSHASDFKELEELKADIQTDQELLADLALNMYLENKSCEILDENDQRWVPIFAVKFVKD
jgi:predicted nuclease with TOPRIM domain